MPSPTSSRLAASASLLTLLALQALAAVAQPLSKLPALGLDPKSVTVSGLSSGGYMAAQFEIAYSRSVAGAAIIAGGPYGCSLGSAVTASETCSCPFDESPDASTSVARAACIHLPAHILAERSRDVIAGNQGFIDSTRYLAKHRVWLYSGDADPVVDAGLVDAYQLVLRQLHVPAKNIARVREAQAGHGMPIATTGSCALTQSPYLNGCGLDGAGDLLKWLYNRPTLQAATPQTSSLKPFDQRPYRGAGDGAFSGLDDSGWIYIPSTCQQVGAHCKLHVVFHGCEQGQKVLVKGQAYGTTFVEQAGYNRWAEGAHIVVLYPQVAPSNTVTPGLPYRFNPKGCWDFWGYTDPNGASLTPRSPPFARKDAPQMRAVKTMIDDLTATP
ncbi:MAG: hypothetical protein KGL90_10175 [Burkholderiales bacterium]|nr:hypothetical protein [Burkholderiales bacterium]